MRQLIPFAFKVSSHVAPDFAAKVATELFLRPRRYPKSKRESDLLATAKVERLQSGRKVYFWGEGPVVTLVHGWESRGSAFYRWIPLLVESGYKVMAWDGPAHGDSPGKKTHAPQIAHSLAEDIEELKLPIYGMIGHSLGGVVVGLVSQMIPVAERVIIISSPAHVTDVFARYHNQIRLSQSARQKFLNLIVRLTGKSAQEVSLAETDLSLKTRTLLIHDVDDKEVPFTDFQILKNSWKQSRFIATSGLGHRRILRDESVGNQIIEFLKSSGSKF